MNTWLDFAIKHPGPYQKQGYGRVTNRQLAEIEGEVKHSMEGSLAAALGELDKLERQASWTISITLDGIVLQHYPLEAITWHGGGLEANRRFVGIEHEGRVGEPLTEEQYQATRRVSQALRALCPHWGAPERRVNLWEHRELTAYGSAATACPSGRIPWDRLLADLTPQVEEDDMALREEFDTLKKDYDSFREFFDRFYKDVTGSDAGIIERIKALEEWREWKR